MPVRINILKISLCWQKPFVLLNSMRSPIIEATQRDGNNQADNVPFLASLYTCRIIFAVFFSSSEFANLNERSRGISAVLTSTAAAALSCLVLAKQAL